MSFDIAELKEALPKQHRAKITTQFIDDLNKMVAEPEFGELYAKNAVTYATVLQEGRFKLTDYFNAVAFVSHKMLGMSSMAAYQKVFPDKVKDMVARNVSNKDMQAYASTYNKNKLVTLIYEQTLIPDHIMYASVRHKAIAAQAALLSSTNEHIVQKAADSLMNHLKAPEQSKLTLDIATNDTGVIADLAAAVANLSTQQRGKILEGELAPKEVAHSPILSKDED
jgi:hypothetical protein